MVFGDFDFIDFLGFNERPFKHELNLSKIYNELDRFRGDFRGLQNYFKKFRVSIRLSSDIGETGVCVSGWTYTPQMNGKDYITVNLHIHTNDFNNHEFHNEPKHPLSWDRFKFDFCKVLAHEFIHVRQAANNDNEFHDSYVHYKKSKEEHIDDEREYHACRQEIEAYGHCMYLETLWDNFKFRDFKRRMRSTGTYIMLLGTYGGDHTCSVISEHKRHCIKWKLKYENN